jgi:AcrR family transcriptional regulator/DNA-binding MarR family transcriptional regulator
MPAGSRSASVQTPTGGRELQGQGGSAEVRIAEIQRSRLLGAAVVAVDERGYIDTTVADITGRARVSRRTFYEQFAGRDECLAAVLDDAIEAVSREVLGTQRPWAAWRERVHGGLVAILQWLDSEPVLARACVVEAMRGGSQLLGRRERVLAQLVAAVDEGRREAARGSSPTALSAEGVVGAALAIVHARLARRDRRPLTGLQNELMAMIVLPYRGAAAARREHEQPPPSPAPARTAAAAQIEPRAVGDPLEGVRMRLTYRTARVLEVIAAHSGASNREIAEHGGVLDPGQISKLLARLQRLGLIANVGDGHAKGEPNAWQLTPLGERVTEQLRLNTTDAARRAA